MQTSAELGWIAAFLALIIGVVLGAVAAQPDRRQDHYGSDDGIRIHTFIGIKIGAIAGYVGGRVDLVIMRIVDGAEGFFSNPLGFKHFMYTTVK